MTKGRIYEYGKTLASFTLQLCNLVQY